MFGYIYISNNRFVIYVMSVVNEDNDNNVNNDNNDNSNELTNKQKVNILVKNGFATLSQVKWGSGHRDVIVINQKKYQYKRGKDVNNKYLSDKVAEVYRKMMEKLDSNKKDDVRINVMRRYKTIRENALKKFAVKYKARVTDEQSAFKNYANRYTIDNIRLNGLAGLSYLNQQYARLNAFLQTNPGMIIMVQVKALFRKNNDDGEIDKLHPQSRRYEIHNPEQLRSTLQRAREDLSFQIENSNLKGSGYVLQKIQNITVNYDRFNPTRGGSYIKLPNDISNKKACINIQNKDNKCFKYSVLCGYYELYKKDHSERVSHYTNFKGDKLNWDGIHFPTNNADID